MLEELNIVYPIKKDTSWKRVIICGGCQQELKYIYNNLFLAPKAENCVKSYNGKNSIWNISGEYVCLICPSNNCKYINEINDSCFQNMLKKNIVDSVVGRVIKCGEWENRFIKNNMLITYKKKDIIFDKNGKGNINISIDDNAFMNFDISEYLTISDRWNSLYTYVDKRDCCNML